MERRTTRAEGQFAVGFGPMKSDEKEYLIKAGFLQENSMGELYGEPSTVIDDTIDEGNEDEEKIIDDQKGPILFHVGEISVRSKLKLDSCKSPLENDTGRDTLSPLENDTSRDALGPLENDTCRDTLGPLENDTDRDTLDPLEKDTDRDTLGPLENDTDRDTLGPLENDTDRDTLGPLENDTDRDTLDPFESSEISYLSASGEDIGAGDSNNEDLSSVIDDTIDEGNEDEEKIEDDQKGQILFHVDEISVRSQVEFDACESPLENDKDRDTLDPFESSEMSYLSASGEDVGASDSNNEDLSSSMNQFIENEIVDQFLSENNVDNDTEEMYDNNEYSTPETSYCLITPPASDCDTPPAIDPESESGSSYERSIITERKHGNGSKELESSEDLDDTISQMEKYLLLADTEESNIEDKQLEEYRASLLKTKEVVKEVYEEETGRPDSANLACQNLNNEFKTPFPPKPTPKKNVGTEERGNYGLTFSIRPSTIYLESPVTFSSPDKFSRLAKRNLSSTPKSTSSRCVNSMLDSPVSTICGSPTPRGKVNIPFLAPGKKLAAPVTTTTPVVLPQTRLAARLMSGRGMPVNSPVAQYIYSTPTPPMLKRAVKTECNPQDKRLPKRNETGFSHNLRSTSSTVSGIPRLQSMRGSHSTSRLSESGFNRRINLNMNDVTEQNIGQQKEMTPVSYHGSAHNSEERNVKTENRLPISTPKIIGVRGTVHDHKNFIAQRHTGFRNTLTDESIVQQQSVNKKFVPVRTSQQKK